MTSRFMRGVGTGLASVGETLLKDAVEQRREETLARLKADYGIQQEALAHSNKLDEQKQKGLLDSTLEDKRGGYQLGVAGVNAAGQANVQKMKDVSAASEGALNRSARQTVAETQRDSKGKPIVVNAPIMGATGLPMTDGSGKPIQRPHAVVQDPKTGKYILQPLEVSPDGSAMEPVPGLGTGTYDPNADPSAGE